MNQHRLTSCLDGIAQCEAALGSARPFGDAVVLNELGVAGARRCLAALVSRYPELEVVSGRLGGLDCAHADRVLLDPFLRGILLDECRRAAHSIGPQNLALALPLMNEAVEECRTRGLVPETPLWTDDRASDARRAALTSLVAAHWPGFELVDADDATLDAVRRADAHLRLLLPELGASSLAHLGLVAMVRHPAHPEYRSLGATYMPAVIGLTPNAVATDGLAVENLLHEATHLKFTEYEFAYAMYEGAYQEPKIAPPWRPGLTPETLWPLSRSATAMHVYTALAVLYRRALAVSSPLWGRDQARTRGAVCFDRATTLLALIAPHEAAFGVAGRRFLRWLAQVQEALKRTTFADIA